MPKLNRKSGAIAASAVSAASALAAAAAYEFEHRRVSRADVADSHVRIQRLWDLRAEKENLENIGEGLFAEWGASAFLGFQDIGEMAAKAGQGIFVAQRSLEDGEKQTAVLQTIRAQIEGDPEQLSEQFPTFADLISLDTWHSSAHKGGDTVILLQITTLGRQERGGGLGSLLRNAALHMQPPEVKYALTTTPVDNAPGSALKLDDPGTYTPAMRFHIRGGAAPTIVLPSYKAKLDAEGNPLKHASDVIVMRYARLEDGTWKAPRPDMSIRRAGPLQQRVTLAWHRLRRVRRRTRKATTPVSVETVEEAPA
ncbi:MAG: hypothetical protein AB7P33_06740 [Dehalococcoidia bacterium]